MIIFVKILQAPGKECSINVTEGESISSVKELVARELDVPVEQQRLVFRGRTLSDESSLMDYNIGPDTKIHLIVKRSESLAANRLLSPAQYQFSRCSEEESEADDEFVNELRQTLQKHFRPEDAEKVLSQFKKDFDSQIAMMTLEDIESVAKTHLEKETSECQQASTSKLN